MALIKIKWISKLKKKEDVYDIVGVEDNHNFVANGMVVHNCDLFGRGVGAVYVKDRNPGQDSWRMKEFNKLGSYNEFTTPNKVAQILKKHPNFWQIIKFPKPSKSLYGHYLRVREANVYNDDNVFSSVGPEDVHKALLILSLRDVMMHDSNLSINRILLHIKNEYDINISKKMVQDCIDDAKQLVARVRDDIQKPVKVGDKLEMVEEGDVVES